MTRRPPISTLVPYSTPLRSRVGSAVGLAGSAGRHRSGLGTDGEQGRVVGDGIVAEDVTGAEAGAEGVGSVKHGLPGAPAVAGRLPIDGQEAAQATRQAGFGS